MLSAEGEAEAAHRPHSTCASSKRQALSTPPPSTSYACSARAHAPQVLADNTRYGTGRLSLSHTLRFVAHHLGQMQISTAVQTADADIIANRAAHISFALTLGMN